MTRWWSSLLVVGLLAGSALGDGAKVQVLRSDGRADAKVRSRVDAALLAQARETSKTSGDQVLPGDITFSEAAAAVGCQPEESACKDEVLGMLSVDAIVVATVTPKPGGFEIVVRRVGKGGPRDATSFVASEKVSSDKIDKLDDVAPVFGGAATAQRRPPEPEPANPSPATSAPPRTAAPPTRTAPPPKPVVARTPEPEPAPAPLPIDSPGDARRSLRLPIAGMAAGGALIVVGVIFWGAANNVQDDIDRAPSNTRAQILELQRLEDKASGYATAGNLMVIGGAVLGGVSTYYFIKRRRGMRAQASAMRFAPAVFPGGGGISLVIGGGP